MINPETVDGWLFPEEGELLEKYASQLTLLEDIIELGAYKGKSTIYLARSSQANVISIDTFMSDNTTKDKEDTLSIFLENITDLPNVLVLPSLTKHIAQIMKHNGHTAKVGLLFIDADHSYEGVKADFDNFSPFVMPGGVVIFHDAFGENGEDETTPWPGVTRFCKELQKEKGWSLIEKCRRCAVFKRA